MSTWYALLKKVSQKSLKKSQRFCEAWRTTLSQHVHTNYSQQVLQPALGYKIYSLRLTTLRKQYNFPSTKLTVVSFVSSSFVNQISGIFKVLERSDLDLHNMRIFTGSVILWKKSSRLK